MSYFVVTVNKLKFLLRRGMRHSLVVLLTIIGSHAAFAQAWMPGFNHRKLITIHKTSISGTLNLLNFNTLIEIPAVEFRLIFDCRPLTGGNLPIAFALKSAPAVPVPFQVDSYDAATGKLNCWVQIAELISNNNPGVNEIYFYYGGRQLHDLHSQESRSLWSVGYRQVWHMNFDSLPAISFSARYPLQNHLIGNTGMTASSFVQGKIGIGTIFNGSTDAMSAPVDTSRVVSISAWVKLHKIGAEQVLLTNDSAGNGYRIRINPQGKIVFDLFVVGTVNSHTSVEPLPLEEWTYLTVIYNGRLKRIYLNGVYKGGGVSPSPKKGGGGTISLARSKENDRFFEGLIDELRIANVERSAEWVMAEYRNQQDAKNFVSISPAEMNPLQVQDANEFIAETNSGSWTDPANWSHGRLPDANTNVTIKAGKTAHVNAGNDISINRLILSTGATLVLASDLLVGCTAEIMPLSSIILKENIGITFKKDVIQNGTIRLEQNNGKLIFLGNEPLQNFSGSGTVHVSQVEVNQDHSANEVLLNAGVEVSGRLELKKGRLNANGQLTLLANGWNNYAVLAPVDTAHARIIGNVKVQQFIEGDFPSPSTARGWWLLSSPVYQSADLIRKFDFKAIQQRIFVTGQGGMLNGFDPSPNNKPTIYIHRQELPGTLSQKYTGIVNMEATLDLGKGFYVFSRGNRALPNAYEQQVQRPPFANPQSYTFTYHGKLFTGTLKVPLFNRDTGMAGDGYNLLGNPYASTIRWGSLYKLNLLPFIWKFDPKNNAYIVTDNQEDIIHPGTGFFVKVSAGHRNAELTFTEMSKYYPVNFTEAKPGRYASHENKAIFNSLHEKKELEIELKKDGLTDGYILRMQEGGNDNVSDADAPKIGEGYISISGLTATGIKLAIDERRLDTGENTIRLFVKGWTSGTYKLNLKSRLGREVALKFMDHYLAKTLNVKEGVQEYIFAIDLGKPETFGDQRFSLILKPAGDREPASSISKHEVSSYPNPVTDLMYIKSENKSFRNLKMLMRKINGQLVWSAELPLLEPGVPVKVPCSQLMKGVYLLQLIDQKASKTIAVLKLLKH